MEQFRLVVQKIFEMAGIEKDKVIPAVDDFFNQLYELYVRTIYAKSFSENEANLKFELVKHLVKEGKQNIVDDEINKLAGETAAPVFATLFGLHLKLWISQMQELRRIDHGTASEMVKYVNWHLNGIKYMKH